MKSAIKWARKNCGHKNEGILYIFRDHPPYYKEVENVLDVRCVGIESVIDVFREALRLVSGVKNKSVIKIKGYKYWGVGLL